MPRRQETSVMMYSWQPKLVDLNMAGDGDSAALFAITSFWNKKLVGHQGGWNPCNKR